MIKRDIVLLVNALSVGFNRALPDPNTNKRGDFQPQFDPGGGVLATFCNLFVNAVLTDFSYTKLDGMSANQIHQFLSEPTNGWIKIDGEIAQAHANNGCLVIASAPAQGHGHVCLICPGRMEFSGSFGKPAPKCVNVGKDVFFGKKVSFAFRIEPSYFVLGEMV